MKKLLSIMAFVAMIALTGCDSDEKLDPNIPLYQDYLVEIDGGKVNTFAYFSAYNSKGHHYELNNGASITANGMRMDYLGGYDIEGFYDYSLSLPGDTKEVKYIFKRNSNTTCTTVIDCSLAPEIRVNDDWSKIANNVRYDVEKLTDGDPTAKLRAVMVSNNTTVEAAPIQANVGVGISYFTFHGLKAGSYTLYVSTYVEHPVTDTDRTASGKYTLFRINTVEDVRVD